LAAYSDQDLLAVFQRFQAERAPADTRADMRFMLPALSVPEITRIYSGIKAGASSDAFAGACELAVLSVEPEVWNQVRAHLQEVTREH
jgi:hypothetical protein